MSTRKYIYIRCDASTKIGTGHFSRCRTIARLLKARGYYITFVCRDHEDSVHLLLNDGEFKIITLPRRNSLSLHDSTQYSSWLGCTQDEDFADFEYSILSNQLPPPVLVLLDHYSLDVVWELHLTRVFPSAKILVIDDLANRQHICNWLLDSSRALAHLDSSYNNLTPSSCSLLLGPRYSLLSGDYMTSRNKAVVRTQVNRIFIFFGGVDTANMCCRLLTILSSEDYSHLCIDICLSAAAPFVNDVRKLVDSHSKWSLHLSLPTLSPLLLKADFAIGSSGVHSWERACLGLPALAFSVASNQDNLLHSLEQFNLVKAFRGDLTSSVHQYLSDIFSDSKMLSNMSYSCFNIVDPFGANRVVSHILGVNLPVTLRPVSIDDMGLYFSWANDPSVRSSSLNSSSISFTSHETWFQTQLSSPFVFMYVLVDKSTLPLGQIRFESSISHPHKFTISLSLDRCARGQGLSSRLLDLGLEALRNSVPTKIEVVALVKVANEPSTRLFVRSGFSEHPSELVDVRCFKLSLRPS